MYIWGKDNPFVYLQRIYVRIAGAFVFVGKLNKKKPASKEVMFHQKTGFR